MKQINEIKRMQQLAGIINENQLFEIDDQNIKQNINKLEDEDILIVTKNLPTEYTDGNKEKVITGLLNIIQKYMF
jgi:galactitol-specific phosphotransferase system IIB component